MKKIILFILIFLTSVSLANEREDKLNQLFIDLKTLNSENLIKTLNLLIKNESLRNKLQKLSIKKF